MDMKKWKKRGMALFLAAAMVCTTALAGAPSDVEAAENEGYLQSKVTFEGRNTYLAYNDWAGEKEMFTWTGAGDTAEPSQFYQFEQTEAGNYVLISTQEGKNNAVSVRDTVAGSNVVVSETDVSDTKQQWVFENGEDGYYFVKNVASGLYLTTPRTGNSDQIDRAFLTVEEKSAENTDSQLWKPSAAVGGDVSEPAETVEGWINTAAAGNMYLSVDGGTAEDGKGIILWTGPEANQKWQFQPAGSQKEYFIVNITTGKALTSPGSDENQQLVQYTKSEDNEAQMWIFESTDTDGEYYIKNKETGLYVTANGTGGLAWIVQRTGSGSALQIWKTDAEVESVPSEMEEEETAKGGLESAANTGDDASDQYLAVNGGSVFDGAELSTWTGINGEPESNQIWEFRETDEEGVYTIVNTNSGKAVAAQNYVEGQRLVQKTPDEKDKTQLWSFTETDNENTYRIWNNSTRFYLTADVKATGSRVLQKNFEDSELQMWTTDAEVATKDIAYDYSVDIVRKDGVGVTYAVDDSTGEITFTAEPREHYEVSDIDLEINGAALGNGTENEDGSVTFVYKPESDRAELTVHAKADVKTTDYYIYNPENDYPGRNQCLSPRVVEGLNGELYATFENGTPSEIKPDEYSFPVYRSDDKGETWTRVGEILNDDTVHPDSYYKITSYTDTGAPYTAEKVSADTEGAVRHPWSMQNCPQLFILPEDAGDLKAGTLICAGVAVPVEEGAEEVSDAGYGGLWDSSLDLYYSTDGGATWTYRSNIAPGGANGRNIMGYDPVWEPFFVYYENTLICYYSDETEPGDNGGQILVYKTSADGGATWSEKTTIVDTNARPGMPVVSQMANGQWILTYETVGWNPTKAGYKIADNPFDWENVTDWGDTIPGIGGVYGGSPYVYTLEDGRTVAGTGSLSEVFVNTREDGTGEWIPCKTGAPAGYNRCYLQLSTGEFLISGTEGPGFAGQNNKIFVKVMDQEEVFSAVPTFDSIKVTAPSQTEYKTGEELNTEGMAVTAVYSDGSSREIDKEAYSVSGYDKNTAGEQTITVTYAGKTDTFTVTVKEDGQEPEEPVLTCIRITEPVKTEYKIGEELDLTGMTVKAVYSDGKEAEIAEGYTVEGFDSKTAGEKEITVTFKGMTAVFIVNVSEDTVQPGGDDQEKPGQDDQEKPGQDDQIQAGDKDETGHVSGSAGKDTQNNKPVQESGQNVNTPKTGDYSHPEVYAAVLLACAVIGASAAGMKIKKKRK